MQVARSFAKLRAAVVAPEAAAAYAEATAAEPATLRDVPPEAFPLFLSSRAFLRMLDGEMALEKRWMSSCKGRRHLRRSPLFGKPSVAPPQAPSSSPSSRAVRTAQFCGIAPRYANTSALGARGFARLEAHL